MTIRREIDLIWNISLVCPWDCEFCCTDAVHAARSGRAVRLREAGLSREVLVNPGDVEASAVSVVIAQGGKPTVMDYALGSRQMRGLELQYEQKLEVLRNLEGASVEIDFAGGDPLACYENYLVIRAASQKFGRESVSITSTGLRLDRYDLDEVARMIGQFEFTFDEAPDATSHHRPLGYNTCNLQQARAFGVRGVRTKAQLPLHSGNTTEEDAERIYACLHEAGISELLLMRVFPVGRGHVGFDRNWRMTARATVEAVQLYRRLEARFGSPQLRLQCALRFLEGASAENPCDLLRASFGINPNGQLLLSAWATGPTGGVLDERFVLGDLSRESFSAILSTERVRGLRARLDDNFGHCKVFALLASTIRGDGALFDRADYLYQ